MPYMYLNGIRDACVCRTVVLYAAKCLKLYVAEVSCPQVAPGGNYRDLLQNAGLDARIQSTIYLL